MLNQKKFHFKMKETKESKCISCEFKKEKNGEFGKSYQYSVKFENGDSGFIDVKKQEPPYQIGQVTKYDIEKKVYEKEGQDPFTWYKVTKPYVQKGYEKRDGSKERVKAHAIECVTKLVTDKKFYYTDAEKDKGITYEQHMVTVANRFEEMMLKALEQKGKEKVYIIMASFDMALVFYIMQDFKRFGDVFNKLMDRI